MINIHWSTLIYIVVIYIIVIGLYRSDDDTSFNFKPLMWIFGAILFTAIWGGIFWW